ncbi:MAG: GGDEF domain-containing protein [Anaerolineales bacterium]|nr:GGDEF domain-containing protein [Anaerolineales bacterium]
MRLPLPPLEPDLGELEAAYRAHSLAQDRRMTGLLLAGTTVATGLFAVSDYRLYGLRPLFFGLLAMRLGYVVLALASLWRLPRVTTVGAFDRQTLVWLLAFVAVVVVINASRPPAYFLSSALDILILLGLYLFVPNPLLIRLLPALALTAAELVIATWVHPPATVTLTAVWATFAAANLLGLAASVQLNRFRRAQFKARTEEERSRKALEALANLDPLTGTFNRRHFFELAVKEFERQQRYPHPLSLLILDIDHFKGVNDQHGHQTGDLALRSLTELIGRQKRAQDIFGRLGGEEFGLLLPETTLEAAVIVGQRLLEHCRALEIPSPRGLVRLTFSAGVTQAEPNDDALDELLYRADQALYHAKAAGRNHIAPHPRPAGRR